MRDQVFMGLYTGHMLGYEEIVNSYRFVTTNAARTLHLGDAYGIGEGKEANFVILDAKNWYDALNFDAPILRNYRKGKLIASHCPRQYPGILLTTQKEGTAAAVPSSFYFFPAPTAESGFSPPAAGCPAASCPARWTWHCGPR